MGAGWCGREAAASPRPQSDREYQKVCRRVDQFPGRRYALPWADMLRPLRGGIATQSIQTSQFRIYAARQGCRPGTRRHSTVDHVRYAAGYARLLSPSTARLSARQTTGDTEVDVPVTPRRLVPATTSHRAFHCPNGMERGLTSRRTDEVYDHAHLGGEAVKKLPWGGQDGSVPPRPPPSTPGRWDDE